MLPLHHRPMVDGEFLLNTAVLLNRFLFDFFRADAHSLRILSVSVPQQGGQALHLSLRLMDCHRVSLCAYSIGHHPIALCVHHYRPMVVFPAWIERSLTRCRHHGLAMGLRFSAWHFLFSMCVTRNRTHRFGRYPTSNQ